MKNATHKYSIASAQRNACTMYYVPMFINSRVCAKEYHSTYFCFVHQCELHPRTRAGLWHLALCLWSIPCKAFHAFAHSGQLPKTMPLAQTRLLQLNNGTTLTGNSHTCTFSSGTGKLMISKTIASPAEFTIWPADYLKHGLWNPTHLGSIPAYIEADDCYDVIGFAAPIQSRGQCYHADYRGGNANVMPYVSLIVSTFRRRDSGRLHRPWQLPEHHSQERLGPAARVDD